jgi:general secretion pathway protein F
VTVYRYEAAAGSGELVSGEMDAASQNAVIEHLHSLGYVPLRADPAHGDPLAWLRSASKISWRDGRVRHLPFLTQQLATLLQANLPLDRALELVAGIASRDSERRCLKAVLDRVRSGSSLADALAAQPKVFPAYYVGMVRAGEASGSLETTMRQLAELLERSRAARQHVKSGLTYPIIVLATGALSLTVLFGFVIPRFRPLFEDAGSRLSMSARLILATSDFFAAAWWVIGLLVVAAIAGARWALNTPAGRERWDRWLLSVPYLRDLLLKIEFARFSQTFGTLLRNGVSPLAAFSITVETVGNKVLRGALTVVMESLKEGKGLSKPLEETGLVPPLGVQLTRVGEETGRLDEMLLKVSDIYQQETQASIDRLLALLVPGVTIALGLIVAVVMGSIVTAILGVYDLAF